MTKGDRELAWDRADPVAHEAWMKVLNRAECRAAGSPRRDPAELHRATWRREEHKKGEAMWGGGKSKKGDALALINNALLLYRKLLPPRAAWAAGFWSQRGRPSRLPGRRIPNPDACVMRF